MAPSRQVTMSLTDVACISETLILATTRKGSRKKTSSQTNGMPITAERPAQHRASQGAPHCVSTTCESGDQLAHARSSQESGSAASRSAFDWLTLRMRPPGSCRW